MPKRVQLAYLVSHPIQYQAPLLRRIAQEPDIDLKVYFGSDFSVRSYRDEGFGVEVKWDVPLLDGYDYEFLPALRDNGTASVMTPLSRGIFDRLRGTAGAPGADVLWVHGYSTANTMQGMLAAKALGIPVLLRADSWLKDRARRAATLAAKRAFLGALEELVHGVLPVGTLNAEYWRFYFGDRVPQFLMPYAVDNGYFERKAAEAAGSRAELLRELEMEPGRPVILYASKLQTRKRCADLVEAYAQLLGGAGITQGWGGAPYLVVVGDGEERERLLAQASEMGLDGVRFCGFRNQSELPRFFDLASVFVLPAEHEPWGLIVNEVMASGRPVIVSDDVGCHPDLITEGVEGSVFPVGRVDELAAALSRVLASPEVVERMGQDAKRRISGWNFDANVAGLRQALATLSGVVRA